MRFTGSVRVSRRTPTWATAAKRAEARPTSATGSISPLPGLRMTITPRKPTSTGVHSFRGNSSPSQALSTNGMKRGRE